MRLLFRGKAAIFLCVFATGIIQLYAQTGKKYTLSQLIGFAEKNLPAIQQREAFVKASQANITDIKHQALPFVKLNAQASLGSANAVNGDYFPMGMVASTSGSKTPEQNNQPILGDLASVYSEYDFYNFGLTKARNQNAQAEAALASAALAQDKYALKENLAKLYFQIIAYKNLEEIDAHNVKRYETIDTIIQSLAKSGIKPGADLFQTNAELANAKIELNRTSAQLQEALQSLSAFTGIPVDATNINGRILKEELPYIHQNEDSFFINNPYLDYYKNSNTQLATQARVLQKSYLPKFTLIGSIWGRASSLNQDLSTQALSNGLGIQRYNYAAGVAFTYDFMDALHKRDKLAAYKFEIQAGQDAYNQEQLDLEKAGTQANTELQLVKSNLPQLLEQSKDARAVYQDKEAQYKAGIVTLIDLTNASFILYRSQVDYLDAIDNWYSATLAKAVVTGDLDHFIQSIK